ncbi:uncharacterized protein conserved in bacteria [Hahella chejuensis KCTC 2396]|uniref:Uncharacterized protein conserved in bacteria n=1 Tax=Hahella chejuensis (strain KCTC 2396) TaxID=349521 RepID=Q2S7X9_HAHCH|nr:DUF692 domain-containing protein [Hahella chejuensis]ABC33245.1 uncharacterized protein conserved in bacteria [Hahella chejuensis KCTC 2396]
MNARPAFSGFGLGLRPDYYSHILETRPPVDWFEIISENYMVEGGKPLYFLDRIREIYPLAMHGVSLSIGSTAALDLGYLSRLKALIDRVNPLWVSDHLCWTGLSAHNSHDLLPLPYNAESVRHVAERVKQVQAFLGRRIALENLSSYVNFSESDMMEWEFVAAVAEEADCWLLLDINNIYVSARNHQFDALTYMNGIPQDRVIQFHVAGHSDYGDYIVDTHDAPVADPVWELYRLAVRRFGKVSAMIERDDNMPEFSELMSELATLRGIAEAEFPRLEAVRSEAAYV